VDSFIKALGGKDNIIEPDACITRLRMRVKSSQHLKDEPFMNWEQKVLSDPHETIQIVLGTKAEKVATMIKRYVGD